MSIKVVPIFLGFCVFACSNLGGYVISTNFNQGFFVRWENIGKPPVEILGFSQIAYKDASSPLLYLQGVNGKSYVGPAENCENPLNCWQEVSVIPETFLMIEDFYLLSTCSNHPRLKIEFPKNLKSCIFLEDITAGSHLIRYAFFVQLNEGNILKWNFIPGMGAFFIIGFIFILSIPASFITAKMIQK